MKGKAPLLKLGLRGRSKILSVRPTRRGGGFFDARLLVGILNDRDGTTVVILSVEPLGSLSATYRARGGFFNGGAIDFEIKQLL